MKKFIILLFVLLPLVSFSQKQGERVAFIKGKVLSGKAKTVKFKDIKDNPIVSRGKTYEAKIDSNSNFSIEIPINGLATGGIYVGKFWHAIALLPGDDLFIQVDADTITYSGKGAEKNNFLYQVEINHFPNYSFEETPVEFLKSAQDIKQKQLAFLKSYIDSVPLQQEYADYYKIEAEVNYENVLQSYSQRYSYMNKIPMDSLQLPEEYLKMKNLSNYVDDSKTISNVYIRNVHNNLSRKAVEMMRANPSKKWNNASYKDAYFTVLFDSLPPKTSEYVLTYNILMSFSNNKYDSLAIQKFNKIEKDEFAQGAFDSALAKYNEKQTLIGQPLNSEFKNTVLRDTANVKLLFGDMMEKYKGKVVYLDFWGMGCGSCRAAMPYSKKLKEKLGDEPIEFVYVSVQKVRKGDWGDVFKATFTDKNHYFLEKRFHSKLHEFMEMNWVPCYMIFDKEGKLVDFNAERPDPIGAAKLEKTLRELADK